MAVGAGVNDSRIDISLWILCVLITVINTAIIIVVLLEKKLRTYTNFFIVSLAVSDALTGAVLFPVYILGPSFMIGYTNAIFIFSGVANVCSLSYDRYVAVFKPFRYRQIISNSFRQMVIACWVIPVLIGLIPLAWQMADAELALRLAKAYVILLVVLVIFPHLCIFFVYCRIFVRLREKSKHSRSLRGITRSRTETNATQDDDSKSKTGTRNSLKKKYQKYRYNAKSSDTKEHQFNYENQAVSTQGETEEKVATAHEQNVSITTKKQHVLKTIKRLSGSIRRRKDSRAERRVAKILAVVVLIFFLSWSPVIYMSLAYIVFNIGEAPTALVVFSAFTVAIGSLVNPVLYAFLKPDLRKGITKLLLSCPHSSTQCCTHSSSQTTEKE